MRLLIPLFLFPFFVLLKDAVVTVQSAASSQVNLDPPRLEQASKAPIRNTQDPKDND